jgi:hypothetical protein
MRTFSPTDAAFAGFRLIRDRPMLVVMWTLVSFGVGLGFVLLALLLMGGAFMNLAQLGQGAEPAPEDVARIFMTMIPLFLLMLPVGLIYIGVMAAGVNRAVLRPQEKSFFYLRLGADEMRQAVVLLVQALAWFGLYLLFALVVAMTVGFGAISAGLAAGAEAPDPSSLGAMFGGILIAGLAGLVVALFLMVKFSLASAQTFHTRAINLFGTWDLTKGRFWPMLGTFLLTFVFLLMIGIAQFVVQLTLQSLALTGDVVMTVVGTVLALIVISVISTIRLIVAYAPAPAIYKAIAVEDESKVFE